MARMRDIGDQTLRLLPGPGENDSFYLKNGTPCVGANAKKKKKTNFSNLSPPDCASQSVNVSFKTKKLHQNRLIR